MASQGFNVDARGGAFNEVHGDQIVNNFHNDKLGLYKLLAPVHDAEYTRSGRVARCLQHTREDVIKEIKRVVDKSDSRICWLKGPAGSGKSAITQTVAEWYADKNRLAASFFFLRGVGSRSAINRFIPSVTYQLSTSIPDTKLLIERVLQNEPSIFQSSFRYQLKKLLIEPILAVQNPILTRVAMTKPLIIVIDALDECDDRGSMAEFIQSLVDVFQEKRRLPVRVFCTSRVEEHLRKKLESSVVHALDLQHFDARVDIRKFLQSRFSAIHKENQTMRSIPLPWPSDTDLDALVRKSEGSFIFADTLVNFIDDGTDFPHRKIQKALRANSGLDTLYSHVLSIAPRSGNVERVIGTIMLLNYLLPITSLAYLLRLETAEILQALLGLQSILLIPADDNQPVRLFHTSLRDFLTAQPRSGIFFIDPPTRHFGIATDCLISIAVRPDNDVVYGGAQEYACLNWCDHFLRALTDSGEDNGLVTGDSLMASILSFVSQSLDFWVNTLIFKRNIPQMLALLASVTSKLQQVQNCPPNLLQVWEYIERRTKLDWELWRNDVNLRMLLGVLNDVRIISDWRESQRRGLLGSTSSPTS